MRLTKKILTLTFFLSQVIALAQTKEELKTQRLEIMQEIQYTEGILKEIQENRTQSTNYLNVLERQIISKENLLKTLNIEIVLLVKQIRKTELSIMKTKQSIIAEQKKLESLKNEYSKIVLATYKQKGMQNSIVFIISSEDFNQAYKRILYLKQYSAFRKNQSLKIKNTKKRLIKKQEKLAQQMDRLVEETGVKQTLMLSKKNEINDVKQSKREKKEVLIKISKSESLVKQRLDKKQKKAKKLEDKIRKIIEEEIRKSRARLKKTGLEKKYKMTPETRHISKEFSNNKGKLPWPLEKGVIVSSYGKQKHPVFNEIETFNNGIDIATDKNSEVRAVFDGEVSRIFFIKGQGKAVLINHGEYFSVYSGLQNVSVKTGEKILSREKIGVVATNEEENVTKLHFEIWKGYDKYDPSIWLYNVY